MTLPLSDPIESRIARRDGSLARIIAGFYEETKATARLVVRNDRSAVKRAARRYLSSPSRLNEIDRYFRSYPALLANLDRRIDFRSSWERTPAIELLGARIAVRILIRREREASRILQAAE